MTFPVMLSYIAKGKLDIYRKELLPEEILYYIYGVLYSNIYRAKYGEFLRTDFPRVSFTSDYDVFCRMGEPGKRLAGLHFMESEELDGPAGGLRGKARDWLRR